MIRTLNLGAGTANREQDEIALDSWFDCKPDVCADVQRLPFKNETFHILKAIHVLEHVHDIVQTMNECWRVLKSSGMLLIAVPLFPHKFALRDPTHVRIFIPETFSYFSQAEKLPGLKHPFIIGNLGVNDDKSEIICELRKEGYA